MNLDIKLFRSGRRERSGADTNLIVRHLLRTVCIVSLVAACGGRTQHAAEGTAGSAMSPSVGGTGGATGGGAGGTFGGAPAEAGGGGAAEAGAAGQAAEAGEGGGMGSTSLMPRALTLVATEPEWFARYDVPDLLVTPAGRIFLETPYKIYEIEGSHVDVYLTDAEAITAVGLNDPYEFGGLGVDELGTLYATFSGSLIRLNAPHQVEFWRTEPGSANAHAMRIEMLGEDDLLALGKDGIWRVTAQIPAAKLFSFPPSPEVQPYAEFALGASGTFLLQPDDAQKVLQRGLFDDSGIPSVETLYDGTFPPAGAVAGSQFLCMTADPAGGFYVIVYDSTSKQQLFHLEEDDGGTIGATRIAVSPAFADAAVTVHDPETFRRCKLAVAPGGTIYLQTRTGLWQMVVQP